MFGKKIKRSEQQALVVDKTDKLKNQLKRLVRSERRLYEIRGALDEQIERMNLLNQFVLTSALADNLSEVLADGLKFLSLDFVVQFGVGVLAYKDKEYANIVASIERAKPVKTFDHHCYGKYLSGITFDSPVTIIDAKQCKQNKQACGQGEMIKAVFACFDEVCDEKIGVHDEAKILILTSSFLEGKLRTFLICYCPPQALLAYREKTPTTEDYSFINLLAKHIDNAVDSTLYRQELQSFAVSLERKVGERTQELTESRNRYRTIFETTPIALIELDVANMKKYLDQLQEKNKKINKSFFANNPKELEKCFQEMVIVDANLTTIQLFQAKNLDDFKQHYHKALGILTAEINREFLIDFIGEGRHSHTFEGVFYTFSGEPINVNVVVSVEPGYEKNYGRVIVAISDITELKAAEKRIAYFAEHDVLTGLANRQIFNIFLKAAITRAKRTKKYGALLYFDLDRFKLVNDNLGHHAGDILLKEVAARLETIIREDDLVARLGGDEFAVILNDLSSEKEAMIVAKKIQKIIEKPFLLQGRNFDMSASIGVASFPTVAGEDAIGLVQNADVAMYAAKENGRNNIQIFDKKLGVQYAQRVDLEMEIKKAVKQNEFFLVYQPVYQLQECRVENTVIVGVEALLRWKKPTGEVVSPAVFIPVLESTGLIVPLGEWIIDSACKQLKEWMNKKIVDKDLFKMAINISSLQLQDGNFASHLFSIIKANRVPFNQIILELTETVLMENPILTGEVMKRIHRHGVEFSIDDFGTGYSSLRYIKELPISSLKIDQSFVRDVAVDPSDAIIVKTIINLAKNLHLDVIAEGVEFQEQLDFLAAEACPKMQGFYLQVPVIGQEISVLLKKSHKD